MVGAATEDIITPSIKELQDRINHLEEENARLRNSIQQCANHQHDINSFGVCQQNNEHNGEDDHATNETIPRSSSQDTSSIVSVKDMKDSKKNAADDDVDHDSRHASPSSSSSLTRDQVERYSRQLLLQDGFGVKGQLQLLSSSVLVVGAGGIGSTVILYLAACGVGKLTIVDFDDVETSNLHRQVIHKSTNVGLNKAESACRAVNDLNPSITCRPLKTSLNYDNAMELISQHDCVVDASDNPQTRYLINDACVLASKATSKCIPLISGSAMGTEGQLSVYNYKSGPCYRCLYPQPNATEGCKSCADNGVLGPVPGLIGILQSLETIKVLTDTGVTMHDRLVMYDSLRCSFFNIKKPPKQPKCPVCSESATVDDGEIKIRTLQDSYRVSQAARGPTSCPLKPSKKKNGGGDGNDDTDNDVPTPYSLPPIPDFLSISCSDYHNQVRKAGVDHVLLDVRSKEQFELCHLKGSINIPLANLSKELPHVQKLSNGVKPVYCICRRGIFSTTATLMLHEKTAKSNDKTDETADNLLIHSVHNITGGLQSWRQEVDTMFPKY